MVNPVLLDKVPYDVHKDFAGAGGRAGRHLPHARAYCVAPISIARARDRS